MAAVLGIVLAVAAPLPASAVEEGSPVGQLVSAVADPDVWDMASVPVGGVRVTGWATDTDLGNEEGTVVVTSGDVVAYGSFWSDWEQWEAQLTLPAGEHTVCASVLNVGDGADTALGCVTATVPQFSPQPTTQVVTVEPLAGQDGNVQVLRVEQPTIHARACTDPASLAGVGHRLGLVVAVDGGSWGSRHPVSSDPLYPAVVEQNGLLCLAADWQVDEPLQPGPLYGASTRLVLDELAPSALTSSGGMVLALRPLEATLVAPAEGAVTDDSRPNLSVQVAETWSPVDVDFAVTSLDSGAIVAEGRATPDDQRVASWGVPISLAPGRYSWKVKVSDQFGQSDWAPDWGFERAITRAPGPTSAEMTDGGGVVQDDLEVAADPEPMLGGSVCLEAGAWAAPITDLSMRLGVVGDDGHRLESAPLAPAIDTQGDTTCLHGAWRVDGDLHPGVRYTVIAQMQGVDVEPSAWFEGESFRALETAADRLSADLNSGALSREDYARYLLYRWFEPDRVPARYQVPEGAPVSELNVVLMDVVSLMDSLDPVVTQELNDYLTTVLGGQESVPFTAEEDQALTTQFWAEAQDLRLDQANDPDPTPEPEPSSEPEPSAEPSSEPTGDPEPLAGATVEPSADAVAVWRAATVVAQADSVELPPEPNMPQTYTWCSDDVGTRLVPRILTASTSAHLRCHLVTPKAVFHYTTSDRDHTHGVAPDDDVDMALLDAASGGGPDGVPDEINAIAAAYFQAGVTYASLGFEPIGRVDVLVADIPAALSVPKVGLVYVSKDTSTRSSVYTMRHELFHQYEYLYANLVQVGADFVPFSASNTTTAWWLEATAEWGAHQAQMGAEGSPAGSTWFQSARGRYFRLIADHLSQPSEALTRFLPGVASKREPQYGSFLFAEYLDQLFGSQVIAETWKAQEDAPTRAIDAIAHVLQDEYDTDLSTVVQAYHRANYTIDTAESVGNRTYTDWERTTWADRLETDRRPVHESLTLQPDRLVRASGSVEAGGAYYVDLDVPTYAPEGVTFTVTIDATSGQREDLTAQIVYFGSYPNLCYPRAGRELDVTPGHAEQVTTLSPSCSRATLIISNDDAQSISAGVGRGAVGFTYTIASRANSTDTVVEYGQGSSMFYRVNFGSDLRRELYPTDSTATLNIDLGQSVSRGDDAVTLNVVSWDGTPRASDALVINGVPVVADLHRETASSDGRILRPTYGYRWGAAAVTWYSLPDAVLHDGVNTIELPVSGPLSIYGAYIYSVPFVEPQPDPDPDPDPGPVAS